MLASAISLSLLLPYFWILSWLIVIFLIDCHDWIIAVLSYNNKIILDSCWLVLSLCWYYHFCQYHCCIFAPSSWISCWFLVNCYCWVIAVLNQNILLNSNGLLLLFLWYWSNWWIWIAMECCHINICVMDFDFFPHAVWLSYLLLLHFCAYW